jgi:hypothetical protein
MTKHSLITLLGLLAMIVLAPANVPAQTFKVDKVDIKGERTDANRRAFKNGEPSLRFGGYIFRATFFHARA